MTRFLKVKDERGLVRDVYSGGIVNVDDQAYKKYKEEKNIIQKRIDKEAAQENRLNILEKKVDLVEEKLNRILDLLTNGNT
ncbi:MAG: hypothetical protein ACK5GV_11375 [Bacteroidota bacterium]|jgi:hypothetical protein